MAQKDINTTIDWSPEALNKRMEIWNKYAEPPKEATKPFKRSGGFSGTDISPMWRIRCLTEMFGPVGIGWAPRIVDHWTEVVETTDIKQCVTCYITLEVKYRVDGVWSEPVSVTGGNTITLSGKGYVRASDEAFKGAYTDALGGFCKLLGIGGAIYWERGYSKYEPDYTDEPQYPAPPVQKTAQAYPAPPVQENAQPMTESEFRARVLAKYGQEQMDRKCMSKWGVPFAEAPYNELYELLHKMI